MMNDRFGELWRALALDASGDGHLTISDVWQWLADLVFLPGDAIIGLLLTYSPALADFLELSSADYGGPMSRIISAAAWFALLLAGLIVWRVIRSVDRFLTAYISGRYAELTRQLRILRRKVTSWIGLMRHRRQSRTPSVTVGGVELGRVEAAVLRCHADVGEFRVITADEVARALKLSMKQVQIALRQLADFRLIERSFGTDEGLEGHHITRAGQIYLIDR